MPGPRRAKSWSRASNGASYAPGKLMPISSPRTAFQTGWPADPLGRRVRLARTVLAVERVLPRLWPALGFIGFYLALVLTGVFAFVAWPLQALALAATITAGTLALYNRFENFVWPRPLG